MVRTRDSLTKEKAAIEEMQQTINKQRISIQLEEGLSEEVIKMSEERQILQQQADKVRIDSDHPWCDCMNTNGTW